MMTEIWDMHIHLDFMRNALEISKEATVSGLGLFGVTVTPQGYITGCFSEACVCIISPITNRDVQNALFSKRGIQ